MVRFHFAGIAAALLISVSGTSAAEPQALKITTLLYNYAAVPDRVLEQAEKSAAAVFRRAGIDTVWASGPLSRSEVQDERSVGPRLYLRILPPSMSERMPAKPTCMGFTQSWSPPVANVFYDRAQKVVRGRALDLGVILGHLIAHEIGHLLIGEEAHSPSGIMSIPWTPRHARSASRGQLLFTPKEAASMRAKIAAEGSLN